MGDDGQLGAEALNVFGFAPEVALGDEQREVGILRARRLDAGVELGLHAFPDGIAVGADHYRAPDRPALGQFRLGLGKLLVEFRRFYLGQELPRFDMIANVHQPSF